MMKLFGFGGSKEPHIDKSAITGDAKADGKSKSLYEGMDTTGASKTQIKLAKQGLKRLDLQEKQELKRREMEDTVHTLRSNIAARQNAIDAKNAQINMMTKKIAEMDESIEEWDAMIAEAMRLQDENSDQTPPEGQKV